MAEGYRIVPRAFIHDGAVWGEGRFYFGNDVYNRWVAGSTLPDSPDVPEGHIEIIQVDGIARAYDRLSTWTRNNG